MKSLIFFLSVLISSVSIYGQHTNLLNQIKNNEGAEQCALTKQHFAKQKLSGIKYYAAQNINITYTRAEWYINPSNLYIKGSVTPYFKAINNQVSTINFELDAAMIVDSVLYHGQPISYADSGSYLLNIYLPSSIGLGSLDSLTIFYKGVPGSSGFGSFIQDYHNGTPIVWTLSEPYGAREWWPCKNDLSDKIDSIDVFISCPAAYRAASNGVLKSETLSGSTKTYHWQHRFPIATYLVAIAVTNYAVYSDFAQLQNATVEILNYVFPEDSASAVQSTPVTIPSLQLYSNLFIEYPFAQEKYGHAQFGWGGGMEHQTMSFMGGFSHELISHELAHQWFGDMVTCGSWADIWLNEGFATYLTGLTYEHMPSYPYWENWKSQKISHIISEPNGSVYCDDTTTVNRIFSSRLSYSKGSYVLHMARWVCGDSAFFGSIRNYLTDTILQHHYAKTNDLKHHLEFSSGKNLTEFFNDWYYGQGYPIYAASVVNYNDGTSEVVIDQTTSHLSVPFFEMPVPIFFSGQGQDTTIIFDHTYSGQSFTISLPFSPDNILFDPEKHIVCQSSLNIFVGMKQENENLSIKVYPNPASDVLKINFEGNIPDYIEILSVDGSIIKRVDHLKQHASFDLKNLSAGVYIIQAGFKDKVVNQKFIKN